jgi:hypothetical protein
VGYDKLLDPAFIVAGSIPPLNESIWLYMNDLGSYNIISSRTTEGVASSEDQTLVSSLSEAIYTEMREEDLLILCAGDRGFCYLLRKARERFPVMKIYVVSWAHAAFHQLKHMRDPNTFFINLDPYVEYLRYSVVEQEELNAELTLCLEENRAVVYPSDVRFRSRVKDCLIGLSLVEFRDFQLRTMKTVYLESRLFVVFTNSRKLAKIQLEKLVPVPSPQERSGALQERARQLNQGSNNPFAGLLYDSDVSDNEDSDYYNTMDENLDYVDGDA